MSLTADEREAARLAVLRRVAARIFGRAHMTHEDGDPLLDEPSGASDPYTAGRRDGSVDRA